jgi:hypothetical protein
MSQLSRKFYLRKIVKLFAGITTLRIMTLSIMTFSITTLSIVTFGITTLSIKIIFVTQHKNTL